MGGFSAENCAYVDDNFRTKKLLPTI